MKKLFPTLLILSLLTSVVLFSQNGITEEKQRMDICNQGFCAQSGASGAIIKVYDAHNNLVGTCTTVSGGCCSGTIALNIGQTYTAYYSNSTCAKNSVTFSACSMVGNVQVPGCP